VPTLLLVRHGRTAANATGVLAGRSVGVHLDEVGREQAVAAGARLRGLPVKAVVTSPLERTVETAEALVATWDDAPEVVVDERFVECGYGSWTGRALKDLAKEPLWKTVQAHPSAVRFPRRRVAAGDVRPRRRRGAGVGPQDGRRARRRRAVGGSQPR
jgi:2,3-bisphosphoglycerate-dependent phosphoglycerate mutase